MDSRDVDASVDVLIVDDQPPFRDAARTVVSLLPGWSVAGEAASGEEAVAAVLRRTPRLVLMDLHLPGIDGAQATRLIVDAAPATRVVLVSSYRAEDLPVDASDCGAIAYVRKEDLTADVLRRALA
jgi:DNA-binding NarL/FixJ family response regulator